MSVSFKIAAGPRQRIHSQVRVPRDLWPHLTVSDSRLPHPGGPGPRIYIPQEQGGPVIPPGTGFLFVASYDSQGYGGGIRPRLHTGFNPLIQREWKSIFMLNLLGNWQSAVNGDLQRNFSILGYWVLVIIVRMTWVTAIHNEGAVSVRMYHFLKFRTNVDKLDIGELYKNMLGEFNFTSHRSRANFFHFLETVHLRRKIEKQFKNIYLIIKDCIFHFKHFAHT
jgi:hypothetical protein